MPVTPMTPDQRRILTVVPVPAFMTLLTVSSINVVLPALQHSVGASDSQGQWVLAGYMLVFGVLLVPAARFLMGGAHIWIVLALYLQNGHHASTTPPAACHAVNPPPRCATSSRPMSTKAAADNAERQPEPQYSSRRRPSSRAGLW